MARLRPPGDMALAMAPELERKILAIRPDVKSIQPLRPDVSSRRYYRLELADNRFCVAVDYSAIPQAGADFIAMQALCKGATISVPEIFSSHPESMLLFQQDLGNIDLSEQLTSIDSPGRIICLQDAIDQIGLFLQMHPVSPAADRSFNFEKLWQEMEFTFAGVELAAFPGLESSIEFSARVILEEICKSLAPAAIYVTHRDYHSRNIMILDGKQYVIDFQDARMGSCYYDITSLLYDPYLEISFEEQQQCLDYFKYKFFRNSQEQFSNDMYYAQAIQRLFKALGTYLHQVYGRGTQSFKKSIANALKRLDEAILRGGYPDSLYLYIQHLSKHSG